MFKKTLILLLFLTSPSISYAVNNCLEEAESNIASLTSTETFNKNYLSIDTSDYKDEDFFKHYVDNISKIFNSIPTIETLCYYGNKSFEPIANGVIGGKYYVIFKGITGSEAMTYQINMVIYDPKTLRKQTIVLESFVVGEGLLFLTTSKFKDGGFHFTSSSFGDFSNLEGYTDEEKLRLNDTNFHADENSGILKRCPYVGIAKMDDDYETYKKGDTIYHCSEKREGYLALEKILTSQADWQFNEFGNTETYRDLDSRFNRTEIHFNSRDFFNSKDDDYLSDFWVYDELRGSPYFYEGSIDNIVDHYATKSIIFPIASWLGTYTFQNNESDDSNEFYLETLDVKSNGVSFKKSTRYFPIKHICDDNYQAHFFYDLLILEYQGDDTKCGYQDNRFIIVKRKDNQSLDIIVRGAHLEYTGWNKFKLYEEPDG